MTATRLGGHLVIVQMKLCHQQEMNQRVLLHWERRLEIIVGVAKGVAYLQGLRKEVIHSDLKPSDILLDEN